MTQNSKKIQKSTADLEADLVWRSTLFGHTVLPSSQQVSIAIANKQQSLTNLIKVGSYHEVQFSHFILGLVSSLYR